MAISSVSSSTSTQTQYPILVNGYLCYNAAQATEARNFINPHPAAKTKSASTLSLSSVSSASSSYSAYTASGSKKTSTLQPRGSLFNLYA